MPRTGVDRAWQPLWFLEPRLAALLLSHKHAQTSAHIAHFATGSADARELCASGAGCSERPSHVLPACLSSGAPFAFAQECGSSGNSVGERLGWYDRKGALAARQKTTAGN